MHWTPVVVETRTPSVEDCVPPGKFQMQRYGAKDVMEIKLVAGTVTRLPEGTGTKVVRGEDGP